jgi:hypothetical protein
MIKEELWMIKELDRAILITEEIKSSRVTAVEPLPQIVVVDDEGTEQPDAVLPAELPTWAMPLELHRSTFLKTATYRCTSCGGEHEEFNQNPRHLPYAKVCGCLQLQDADDESDGSLDKCTGVAIRRTTYPGEFVALNARRFEPLVIYERANYDTDMAAGRIPRNIQKYYMPGQNNEPTEAGYKRIEMTNIQEYNRVVREINRHEVQKMTDHRDMHREYFQARRKAMREDVNARIRHNPTLVSFARIARRLADAKFAKRYGKNLDSRFHAQLIEFNQGNIQDWCSENTGWKSRRAK